MPTKYSPQQVDEALIALAYTGGNGRKASQITGIPQATLYEWRTDTHRERYMEIAERERPKLEQLAVGGAVAQIIRADDAGNSMHDRLAELLENPDASPKEIAELAGAIQRIQTAKGINGTKLLEFTGRPTQIHEHRDATQILKGLQQRFPGLVVDAEAQEIPATQSALPVQSGQANARS